MKFVFIAAGLLDLVAWILFIGKLRRARTDLAAEVVKHRVTSMYLENSYIANTRLKAMYLAKIPKVNP